MQHHRKGLASVVRGTPTVAAFLYRCPITNEQVQAWAEDADGSALQTVECLACQRTHLLHPKTGKVMGSDPQMR
jgi:hypothetical protein